MWAEMDTPLMAARPQTRLQRRSGEPTHPRVSPLDACDTPPLRPPLPSGSSILPAHPAWPQLARCTSTPLGQSEIRTWLDFDEVCGEPRPSARTDSALFTGWTSTASLATPSPRRPGWLTSDSGFASDLSGASRLSTSGGGGPRPPAPVILRDLCSLDATAALEITSESIIKLKRWHYSPGHFQTRQSVDFLRHLFDRNMSEALHWVLGALDPPSLCQVALVSPHWRDALHSDFESVRRRDAFVYRQKLNLENLSVEKSVWRTSPRKAMSNVSNLLSLSPSHHAKRERENKSEYPAKKLVSPSKIRHQLFTEEASKLGPGEQLQVCPRCTAPSRVSDACAQCSRRGCGFSFCTLCMCEAHLESPCRTTTTKSGGKTLKGSTIASKRSKNRLKRL
eukprot:maker-scaffold1048_size67263-snap-gene-0.23 protein:Tk10021 transcript:maker-scaffold1048_size67263-snap-gene-0.23-mRNA-1 annotation:"f-box only protein 43"